MPKELDDRSARAFMAQPHVRAMLDSFGPVDPNAYQRYAEAAPSYDPTQESPPSGKGGRALGADDDSAVR